MCMYTNAVVKAKITKSVVSQQIFIQKALSQKRNLGGG